MKSTFTITILFLLIIISNSNSQDHIPFTALDSDNEGIFGVNGGNVLPDSLCAPVSPPYQTNLNIMSANYQNTFPGYVSGGHLIDGTLEPVVGFDSLMTALEDNGKDIENIHIKFTQMWQDTDNWLFVDLVDTRMYTGGMFSLVYIEDGIEELIVNGPMPMLHDVVRYNDYDDCFDDEISGSTEYFIPQYAAQNSSVEIQNIANALVAELAIGGVKVDFYGLQTAIMGIVTVGTVWSVTSGALVKGVWPVTDLSFEFPAFGENNDCTTTASEISTGSGDWIDLRYNGGLVASVLDLENMGEITCSFYTNSGTIREDGNGIEYMDRNIEITPSIQPSGNIPVRLYMPSFDLDLFFDANDQDDNDPLTFNDMMLSKFDITCSPESASNGELYSIINWGRVGMGAAGGYYFDVEIPGFSSFFLHGPSSSPLPLELIDFKGQYDDNKIKLDWSTENELNTYKFEIERGTDVSNFQSIATIMAENKFQTVNNYQYIDKSILNDDIYYYRLKLVDINGRYTYSKTIKEQIKNQNLSSLIIAPMPVKDVLSLHVSNLSNNVVSIAIFNDFGIQLKQLSLEKSNIQVDVNDWKNGLYFIQLLDKSNNILETLKFVKQ